MGGNRDTKKQAVFLAERRHAQDLLVAQYAMRIGEARTNEPIGEIALAALFDPELMYESRVRIAALLRDRTRAIGAKLDQLEMAAETMAMQLRSEIRKG